MRVVAIVQARMGSSRLPGKVMLDLAGETVLGRCIRRLRRANSLDEVVIATTTNETDNAIVDYCRDRNWPVVRGSEQDVLSRYWLASQTYQAEVVVRVTSDCPLIEPMLVDELVEAFLAETPGLDYLSNVIEPRCFPRGLDIEVFSVESLQKAFNEAEEPAEREHVTPYIWCQPTRFALQSFEHEPSFSDQRWTVDTLQDYELVRRVFHHFKRDNFHWRDVLTLLEQHPDWLLLNSDIQQKTL